MQHVIECKNLTHYYGESKIFEDFNFNIPKGKIIGLLGKNGVGKSTTINILMGFLKPTKGECLVFNEPSNALSAITKEKIALLHEGHIQYDFMNIEELERFYSKFYKKQWKKERYYMLIDKLGVPYSRKISKLSCGQRSQVVLGLIFAQDAEVLILDDYSMGLDAGYRSLFLEYLKEFVIAHNKTVLMTTHIVQDLEEIIDDIIILDKHQKTLQMPLKEFLTTFTCLKLLNPQGVLEKDEVITNFELFNNYAYVYSFKQKHELLEHLSAKNICYESCQSIALNFETAFLGYTGRY